MSTILIIVLVLLLVGAFAGRGYSGLASFGYYPSGILGLILIVVVILALTGRL